MSLVPTSAARQSIILTGDADLDFSAIVNRGTPSIKTLVLPFAILLTLQLLRLLLSKDAKISENHVNLVMLVFIG